MINRFYVLTMGPKDNTWNVVERLFPNSDRALEHARYLKKRLGENWRVKITREGLVKR